MTAAQLDRLVLPGGSMLSVRRSGTDVLVVPLVPTAEGARRAIVGDGAFAGMLEAMRIGKLSDRFAARTIGSGREVRLEGERAIEVDQSNESVVVGEQAVVKLYPRTSAGPQPGLDLPVHLAAVGFTAIPAPLGAITWTDEDGAGVLLAAAASFLPGARDGWDWYLERVLGWLDGQADDERAFDPAPPLGRLAAQMHAALATASGTIPEPMFRADAGAAGAWRDAGLTTLEEAIAVTGGEEGGRLGARADRVREALEELSDGTGATLTRIHGDFHVGQVLRWDGGYAVADFDGDPVAPVRTRAAFDTPVRDVAAFVRSIDHLGRIAQARRPGREADVASWIAESRAAFLDAYEEELTTHSRASFDRRLLFPLEVIQELHEYVYAARFLPRWRYVPDLAMCALFPEPVRWTPLGFLQDLEAKPAVLAALEETLSEVQPWGRIEAPRRVVFLGMGSSRYASAVAAGRLRARGIDAWAEFASAATAHPGGPGTLVVGISASGTTEETVAALARHAGRSATAALTNLPGNVLTQAADTAVPMSAGTEVGGVACRTFQHTLVMLLALEARLAPGASDLDGLLGRTREATADLLERRDAWLPRVAELLAEGPATFVIAPAERLSSAQQGALMLREGPRRLADACESGDWLHVDVYLTRPLDYRALLFAGSRFDAAIMAWMRDRGARVVSVGADVTGADLTVRYRHDDDPDVALLTEVLVAELVAARWWLAQD